MRIVLLLTTIILCAGVSAAHAATVTLQMTDGSGKPLPDAVATLTPESGAPPPAKLPPRDHVVDQQDETFIPLVEVLTVGDTVTFRNSDRTRHHVYTFSELAPFDFVLKPRESSAPKRLEKAGVIAVGCNIHDFMINYLFVSDSRWAAKSDSKGVLKLNDVPAGSYVATLWHPRLRGTQPTQKITVGGDGIVTSISLPVSPEHHDDVDRNHY